MAALPYGQSFFNPLDVERQLAVQPGAHEGEGGSLGGSSFVRNYRRMVAAQQPATLDLSNRLAGTLQSYADRLNVDAVRDPLSETERSYARNFFTLPWTQAGREELLRGTVGASARSGYSDPQSRMDSYLLGQTGMAPLLAKKTMLEPLMQKLAQAPPQPVDNNPIPGPGGGTPTPPPMPEIDWSQMFPDWDALFARLFPPVPDYNANPAPAPAPTPTPTPAPTPAPTQNRLATRPNEVANGYRDWSPMPGVTLPSWMDVRNGVIVNANALNPNEPYKNLSFVLPGGLTVGQANAKLAGAGTSTPAPSPAPAPAPSNGIPIVNGKPAWGVGAPNYDAQGNMLPPDGHTGGIPWTYYNGQRGVMVPNYGFFVGGLPPALNVKWAGTPGASAVAGLYLTNLGPSSSVWALPSGFSANWFIRGATGGTTTTTTPPSGTVQTPYYAVYYAPAPPPPTPTAPSYITDPTPRYYYNPATKAF